MLLWVMICCWLKTLWRLGVTLSVAYILFSPARGEMSMKWKCFALRDKILKEAFSRWLEVLCLSDYHDLVIINIFISRMDHMTCVTYLYVKEVTHRDESSENRASNLSSLFWFSELQLFFLVYSHCLVFKQKFYIL